MEPAKEPSQDQRNDPNLRAEIAFYDALIEVDLKGAAYYDVRVGKQVDTFAWFRDRWRCAMEVKGGQHMVNDGFWYRRETNGNYTKLDTSPPDQAMAAAMAVRDTIKDRLREHKVWVNVILVLPDMPAEDAAIRRHAKDRKVGVIWGLENLEEQLLRIIAAQPDRNPPDELDIMAETAALKRSAPPQEWLTRKAAQNDAVAPDEFTGQPRHPRRPASNIGGDATAHPTYVFEIHNDGTLIIQLGDAEMPAFRSDASDSVIAGMETATANTPDPFAAAAIDDGVVVDAQPDLVPDPFDGGLVGDGFDDNDPFS